MDEREKDEVSFALLQGTGEGKKISQRNIDSMREIVQLGETQGVSKKQLLEFTKVFLRTVLEKNIEKFLH